MANPSLCSTCIRALRQQARKEVNSRSHFNAVSRSARAAFSTSHRTLLPEEQHKQHEFQPLKRPPQPSSFDLSQFASQLRNTETLRGTTEPYIAYGGTEDLYKACAAQCDYTIPNRHKVPPEPAPKNGAQEDIGVGTGWWFTPKAEGGLGLEVTFNTWAQVMMLHIYMLTARLRCFPKEHAGIWLQNLIDHFSYAAEDRMAVEHGMSARGVRNKYLKDLFQQWRGCLISYDEGVIKGDAVLATAVWRNIFKASEDVDVGDVAAVTGYLRRELRRLDEMEDTVLTEGRLKFGNPVEMKSVLGRESPWMRKTFSAEDLKGLEESKSG